MMFISTSEFVERTGLSRPTIWRYSKRYPDFPKPVVIGTLKRWVVTEIDGWLFAHRLNGKGGQP